MQQPVQRQRQVWQQCYTNFRDLMGRRLPKCKRRHEQNRQCL
ncbi:hypothetical protein [Schleiferilactobacillus harbinensis]